MLDAKDYHHGAERPPAERCVHPSLWVAPVPLEDALVAPVGPKGTAIFATANHGRWIAECPDCAGAQLTAPEDPRFMCVECGNVAIGGVWRPVVWPKDHAEIGALLDVRPRHLANANPGETLAQIRAENKLLSEATMLGGDA